MQIPPFKLERYFAEYEFKVQYLLSPSDCEALSLAEVLALADADSRRRWDDLSLGYTESQGHPALRAEVARLYRQVAPEGVLIAAPEELIFIAMHTLVQPGDRVVCIAPAYQSLYEIARARGCELAFWPVELRRQGWTLDLARLESSLTDRTRLLIVNFPHNPTGCLPAPEVFAAILDLARARGVTVFSDEMYRQLEFDPASRLPAACDVDAGAVSLSGLSKAYALPGLRLGWLATQNAALVERWLAFKDYTTICSSAPSEILALAALRAGETVLARSRTIVQTNLRHAEAFFGARPDLFTWIAPQAGTVALPRWEGPGPVEDFCADALERQGVMIVPGSLFDAPAQHFRVGLGRKNFPAALARLAETLQT